MDQEREKLARLTALACEDAISADGSQEAYDAEIADCTRIISAALEQWGDLRAEQVRRETVEALAGALCAGCAQELPLHDSIDGTRGYHTYPQGWKGIRVEPYHCSGYEVRRAFAASQGGTNR